MTGHSISVAQKRATFQSPDDGWSPPDKKQIDALLDSSLSAKTGALDEEEQDGVLAALTERHRIQDREEEIVLNLVSYTFALVYLAFALSPSWMPMHWEALPATLGFVSSAVCLLLSTKPRFMSVYKVSQYSFIFSLWQPLVTLLIDTDWIVLAVWLIPLLIALIRNWASSKSKRLALELEKLANSKYNFKAA